MFDLENIGQCGLDLLRARHLDSGGSGEMVWNVASKKCVQSDRRPLESSEDGEED